MKQLIIKALVLLMFFSLIGCFVAYRSGSFDDALSQHSANMQSDTIPKQDSSQKKVLIPSSKTMILHTESKKPPLTKLDSLRIATDKYELMSGSKTGFIAKPSDFRKLRIDSTHKDSIIKE